jgi:ferredoxin
MPTVRYRGRIFSCAPGAALRDVLLANGDTPHSAGARLVNCRGLGSCGTCAVRVHGPASETTFMERWRLAFPPHRPERELRLACQLRVLGDLDVEKLEGFWGQGPGPEDPRPEDR